MKTYSAIDVAKRFLELAQNDATAVQDLTNMKLQKLCFFAQLVSVFNNAQIPLIAEPFHAWDYGPVEPKLFRLIKHFGATYFSLNTPAVAQAFSVAVKIDDPDALEIIGGVWEKFKTWTAVNLSQLTHRRNSPWAVVYNENRYGIIPNEYMVKYCWGED